MGVYKNADTIYLKNASPKKTFLAVRQRICNSYPLHSHDYFEIELVLSGGAREVFNGKQITATRGTAVFLTPADLHSLEVDDYMDIYKILIPEGAVVSSEALKSLSQRGNVFLNFQEDELERLTALIEITIKEQEGKGAHKEKMLINLMECILLVFLRKLDEMSDGAENPLSSAVQNTIIYTLANFRGDISSRSAAEAVGLNPSYFSHLFKTETGMTYNSYLREKRLEYAANLLMLGDYGVSEVCFECGFNSASNFLKAFKEKYGVSPQNYKQKKSEK